MHYVLSDIHGNSAAFDAILALIDMREGDRLYILGDVIETDKEGNPLTYIDIIKVDDTIADDLDRKFKIMKVAEYIKTELTDREREIIVLRYGLGSDAPITQRCVAEKLGISRSYVSRIEKCALEKLRRKLTGRP